jgi:hypothetical protein
MHAALYIFIALTLTVAILHFKMRWEFFRPLYFIEEPVESNVVRSIYDDRATPPWDRAPIESVPEDLLHDRRELVEVLHRALAVGADASDRDDLWREGSTPSSGTSPSVQRQYARAIEVIDRVVGETLPRTRVVHDRWTGVWRHRHRPGYSRLLLEILIYEPFAHVGHHLEIEVICKNDAPPTVIKLEWRGVLFEDKLGFQPSMASASMSSGSVPSMAKNSAAAPSSSPSSSNSPAPASATVSSSMAINRNTPRPLV